MAFKRSTVARGLRPRRLRPIGTFTHDAPKDTGYAVTFDASGFVSDDPIVEYRWEVLDLKLPDAKLTLNTKFHPGFSATVFKAVQQLYNYREYFNRPDVSIELKKKFGFAPRNPRLSILIGRNKQHDPDVFIAAQGKFKMLDIEFITYDELLESHANQIIIQSSLTLK